MFSSTAGQDDFNSADRSRTSDGRMWRSSRGGSEGSRRRSKRAQIHQHASRVQRLSFQMVSDQSSQNGPRRRERRRVGKIATRQRQNGQAGQALRIVRIEAALQTSLKIDAVPVVRIDRLAVAADLERRYDPQIAQQVQLEAAQNPIVIAVL